MKIPFFLCASLTLTACGSDKNTTSNKDQQKTVDAGGDGAAADSGGGDPGPRPSSLPTATEACPPLVDGDTTFLGRKVRLFVDPSKAGQAPAPVAIYWHATGSNPNTEPPRGLGPGLQEIVDAGGIVIAPYSEPALACPGCTGIEAGGTGNGVWFKKDFETADEALACALDGLKIDTRRIYTAGWSAGGLQASAMFFERSNYLASVVSYSGGRLFPTDTADPDNHLPILLTYGGPNDRVIIAFKDASENMGNEVKGLGSFVVMCDHGGGHKIPDEMGPGGNTWQWFKDHPYGVSPEPYVDALPATFPGYCKIW